MRNEVKRFIKSISNFNKVITQAGGCPFSLDDLDNTSALELIDIISCNDIEFTYAKKHDKQPQEILDPNSPYK